MRRFQWTPTRWIQRRTNSSIHHKNKISYTFSIHSTSISSSYVYTPPNQYYDNFGNLSLWGERRYSTSCGILPHIHIDALSYAQYPLQLKLLQYRWFSSKHGRRISMNQDPDMRVCQSIDELTQMAYEHKDSMSPRGMSAYWTLVSKLLKKNKFEKVQNIEQMNHQLNDILGHTLQDINAFGYRDLSTVAIGLAKIVKNVSGSAGKRLPRNGGPQQVLHELIIGDNSLNKEFIFKVLAEPSMIILHKFEARHLSNLIYAYGLAEYVVKFDDGSTLFDLFSQAAIPNLHKFNGQDLSNMLWAYANVKASNSQLFEHAGDSIVATNNLNEFWPQALSNIIWAYATLDDQHPRLFKKVANHIVALDSLDRYAPQALSNIIWAYATLDEQNPMLFKKVADHIVTLDNLDKFDPQALSNTVWSYATAGENNPKLFKKVGDHIVQIPSLNEFKPQHLSNILWAFATAGESHPQLFKKLTDEAIKRQHEFTPQQIANFLWAFATNGQVDEHLFSSLVPSVKANLDVYTAQGLVNIAWAYSVANVDASSVFNEEFTDACLRKENSFNVENLSQLHQWQLWQDEIKSGVSLPSSLEKRCYEAFVSQEIKQSKLQDDVISNLSSIGLQPHEEVLLKSGYRIDAVVEVNGEQIAVEVDGPSHFIGNRELTGSTILKQRQVATLDGMKVVSVPYWNWIKLKNDTERKKQHLQHLLSI